jgi:hypothetical protein
MQDYQIILLMAIVDSSAIFQGTEIHKKQVQKYVFRRKDKCQKYRGVYLALVRMENSG